MDMTELLATTTLPMTSMRFMAGLPSAERAVVARDKAPNPEPVALKQKAPAK